jgi:hypothetical protein
MTLRSWWWCEALRSASSSTTRFHSARLSVFRRLRDGCGYSLPHPTARIQQRRLQALVIVEMYCGKSRVTSRINILRFPERHFRVEDGIK